MSLISINNISSLISNDKYYILIAGAIGSGKSYIVSKFLSETTIVDPDIFTMQLGDGIYNKSNVAKSMSMVKQQVHNNMVNNITFIQQGTSANLQSTINKLNKAKEYGYKTILIYIDTPINQCINNVQERLLLTGRGESITPSKIERTYNGSLNTYIYLTNNQNMLKNLDYWVKFKNIL